MNKRNIVLLGMVPLVVFASALYLLRGKPDATSSTEVNTSQQAAPAQSPPMPQASSNTQPASLPGSYITLAEYTANPTAYAQSKVVYFFHASWCYICQGIENEIKADPSKLPAGVTLVKTDFDKETALRKKYGVTTQYTFVYVDASGNEQAQWSASDLAKVIAGIPS